MASSTGRDVERESRFTHTTLGRGREHAALLAFVVRADGTTFTVGSHAHEDADLSRLPERPSTERSCGGNVSDEVAAGQLFPCYDADALGPIASRH
jgi:hypothetical protein